MRLPSTSIHKCEIAFVETSGSANTNFVVAWEQQSSRCRSRHYIRQDTGNPLVFTSREACDAFQLQTPLRMFIQCPIRLFLVGSFYSQLEDNRRYNVTYKLIGQLFFRTFKLLFLQLGEK